MGKSKKIVWGIAIIGVAVCFIFVILFGFNLINKPVYINGVNKNGTDEVKVELFYNGPCESCKENEKFNKSVRENILKSNRNAKINCIAYNIFKEPDKEYMEKRIKALGISDSDAKVPFALIDGKLYKGSYEEIGSQIGKDIGKEKDIRSIVEGADSTDSIILLFTTYSCDSCAEVKKYIQASLKSEYIIKKDQGNMLSKVKLIECNILDSGNLDLLNELMKQYGVPDDEQQVPIVFYQNGFLSGETAIKDGLVKVIENGSAMGFSWKVGETSSQDDRVEGKDLLKLGATGFLNGLNPCSASMLLMVLSLLLMSGNDFIKGSLSYMAGKILAYLGMGMGAFFVFAVIKEAYFTRMEQILTMCFAVLALVLSILNFIDFWNAKKKNYGRIIVQLPKKLRHFNHTVIKKLENIPRTFFLPMLFVLGVVISAGEFFCTGQLYAASILYMVKQNQVMTIEVFWMLLIYVLAMCLPQGIIIFIINKSRNLLAVSRFTLKGMTAVKLIYGFLFLLLFILLLFF